MSRFEKILTKLLNQEKNIKESDFFLSLYQPLKDKDKKKAAKKLKSLISTQFKNYPDFKKSTNIHHQLIDIVNTKINRLADLENGLGLFVKFNKNSKTIADKNITLLSLPQVLKKQIFLEKTYNLDQLAWISSQTFNALVLDLKKKACRFYKINSKREFKKLDSLENEFTAKQADEYLEKYAPLKYKSAIYSTGGSTAQKRQDKVNQLFLKQVLDYINTKKEFKIKTDYILLFYSDSFTAFIDSFKKKLSGILIDSKLVLMPKNINKQNLLKKEALQTLNKLKTREKKTYFKQAKNNYKNFIKDINKIVELSRQKRISVLFLRPNLKLDGFIKNSFVYLVRQEGSKKVSNIIPWLVKSVLLQSGKIILMEKKDKLTENKIAALKRF